MATNAFTADRSKQVALAQSVKTNFVTNTLTHTRGTLEQHEAINRKLAFINKKWNSSPNGEAGIVVEQIQSMKNNYC